MGITTALFTWGIRVVHQSEKSCGHGAMYFNQCCNATEERGRSFSFDYMLLQTKGLLDFERGGRQSRARSSVSPGRRRKWKNKKDFVLGICFGGKTRQSYLSSGSSSRNGREFVRFWRETEQGLRALSPGSVKRMEEKERFWGKAGAIPQKRLFCFCLLFLNSFCVRL